MSKPSVVVGNPTKKSDYDNLVKFVAQSDIIDGSGGTTTLTAADFGRTIVVNSASNRQVNLPSVDSSHVGGWFRIVKLGAGDVTIAAADSDSIQDGAAGGTIANNQSNEIFASIDLMLASSTKWIVRGGFGQWATNVSTIYPGLRSAMMPGLAGVLLSAEAYMAKISKPGNPSSGFVKLYPKSDDALYFLTSGGVEKSLAFSGEGLPVFGFGRRFSSWKVAGASVIGIGCSPAISGGGSASEQAEGEFISQSVTIGVGNAQSINVPSAATGANFQRRWNFDWTCSMKSAPSKNDAKLWFGLCDTITPGNADDPASRHIAAFRWSFTIGGGANWYAVTKDGTTINAQDTGVAFSISTAYNLRIRTDGTNVYFYINGVLVATATTNLPGSSQALLLVNQIVNNSASTGWSVLQGAVSCAQNG